MKNYTEHTVMNPAIVSHGPSRYVVWSIKGKEYSERVNHVGLAIATMSWKIHMDGADWAECRDEEGRMNHRSERKEHD